MTEPLHILVVDDDYSMAKTLSDILRIKGYLPRIAHSGDEALRCVAEHAFDCVLSDIRMPGMDGVTLYREIKARWPNLPAVLMTAYSSDSLVQEGLQEGIVGIMDKPLDIERLLVFLDALANARSIAVVDDDPEFCSTLADLLRAHGLRATQILDPSEAVSGVDADTWAVVLDMKFADTDGLQVLRAIRTQHPLVPVILVTGYGSEMASAIETALQVGAYGCLYKPVEMQSLLEILGQIRRRQLSQALEGQS
jgi:two-component system response regulator HydG